MDTSSELPIPSSAANPPVSLEFLGPAPLIHGDAASGYDTLLARVLATVKPAGIIEEIWVRDVVDLVWDAVRLRRHKAALMTSSASEGLQKVLSALGVQDTYDVARQWARREETTVAEVDALLASSGLTMDAVMAQTLRVRIAEIERIDRMTMAAEARRNVALRELEHHRACFAALLRRAAQEADQEAEGIEDAEFEVVPPQTGQIPSGVHGVSRARKAYANRANGRRSNGAKTAGGKERVARAGRRHGLCLPVLHDPVLASGVDDLARRIATSVPGADVDARRHELASRIAEAQIDLVRVRRARLPLLAELPTDPKAGVELLRLDRYERRALSRRKLAIRAFDAAAILAMAPNWDNSNDFNTTASPKSAAAAAPENGLVSGRRPIPQRPRTVRPP